MRFRLRWLPRMLWLAGGLLVSSGAWLGCGGGDETTFTEGVRVDQILARDLAVTVAETTAVLGWVTRDVETSLVNYGLTGNLGTLVTGDNQPYQHRVELTGLTANTIYYFRVSGSDTTYAFRTMGGQRQRIAFVSDRADGRREVYLAYEYGENVTRVTTGGGHSPALSRDGTRLAWVGPGAGGRLDVWQATLDTAGVVPGSITNVTNTADREEYSPDWSPDRSRLVFVAATGGQASQILIRTIASSAEAVVQNNGAANQGPRYKPDGSLIAFASTTRTSTIQVGVPPIDLGSLQVTLDDEARTPVSPDQFTIIDAAQGLIDCSAATVSDRGIYVSYRSNGLSITDEGHAVPRPHLEIFTVKPDGTALRRLTESNDRVARMMPAWHPTENLLVFVGENGTATNLYTVSGVGGGIASLTGGAYLDRDPVWSPEGGLVLLSSNRHVDGLVNLHRADLGGNVLALNLFSSGDTQPSWSVVP